jgi:hypothetical protein
MSFQDFSSWPRDQEQTFVVYEQRIAEVSKKAITLGAILGGIVLVLAIFVYAGVEPEKHDIAKDMNMENLTKRKSADTPAP